MPVWDADSITDGPVAPVDNSHGWPGVAGYTHDGEAYCVDCAEEVEEIDTSGESDQAVLADAEWDAPGPVCGGMFDCPNAEDGTPPVLPVRLIVYEDDEQQ